MYENEIYSGSGSNTSGVFSGAQSAVNQTENNAGSVENGYTTYQTANSNTFANSAEQKTYTNYSSNYDNSRSGSFENSNFNNSNFNNSSFENGSINNDNFHNETFSADAKPEKKKSGKGSGFFRKAILSISMGLFFGLFAGIGFYAVQQGFHLTEQTGSKNAIAEGDEMAANEDAESGIKLTNTNNVTVIQSDVSDMVEEVMPAMVSIVNNYTETVNFFGQTFTQEQPSSGSGIIVAKNDTELLIVSNYHVIADATSLEVTFIDSSTAEAKVKGTDAEMDLAVIAVPLEAIDEETKNAISIATLGESDNLRLGEPVVAIGNALGYGQSVTNGIVSALDREIEMSDGSKGTFIQTNAAINPGNSGGALLNVNGEVVGINSNKIGGDVIEGMGYAIPISSASPIIAELMERHTREEVVQENRGYIGITLQVVTSQESQMFNMPVGIYVIEVEEGSAAEAAGLVPGDIITRFDGEKITTADDLQSILQYFAAGDTAQITIMRLERGQYVEYDFDITLGSRPSELQ